MSHLNISAIPLALYIHIPWCIRKCPYCDFNSHEMKGSIDFAGYVDALLADAYSQLPFVQGRKISSIFIGGGTPSLLPIKQYQRLFEQLRQIYDFVEDIEVTMEANPATIEHAPFDQYLSVGINRLSIGVQTFNGDNLQRLGRIHNADQALTAVKSARQAGFERVNVDLMHGLPMQRVSEALFDIEQAIEIGATHLSWYQLTIEPNTIFYRSQPTLPDENTLAQIEEQGRELLLASGFNNYEVSAWHGATDKACLHNTNYWQFGDYLAIGAGAHGKVSMQKNEISITVTDDTDNLIEGIYRFSKSRLPKDYTNYKLSPKMVGWQEISKVDLIGEFMLDALRLNHGVSIAMFEERTGLSVEAITPKLNQLIEQGLLLESDMNVDGWIKTTALGSRYLNQVIQKFI